MSLFVRAPDHSQRLFGRARCESSIVEPSDVRDRLRTIRKLRDHSDVQLDAVMKALESWDIVFQLNDDEKPVYNRPNGGYLFPSMRPSAELVRLPILTIPADVASERWLAEQVRTCSRVRSIPFSSSSLSISLCCQTCCLCRARSFACRCVLDVCTTHRIDCSATALCCAFMRLARAP